MRADDDYAALDLGSNSFHLLLARRVGGHFETVDRAKEKVQLLAGFADGRLHPEAVARGEACLARFAQRLAAVPLANVQMAGTHALREARDTAAFGAAAERIVGVPLEVVSGAEEGRLVYLGVNHHVPCTPGAPRLVVDIGGGSTEFAWGEDCAEPADVASYKLGCVALRDWHFQPGVAQGAAYSAARRTARDALSGLAAPTAAEVIGTSGTVESVQTVLAANGWGAGAITRAGLAALTEAVVSGRWLVEAGLPGLAPDRVDIFPAGLAVVDALFEVLGLETMRFVDASLQNGLLCRHFAPPGGDLRDGSVARLQERFGVDRRQAARVRTTALALFDSVAAWWTRPERWRPLLGWAADLHELGKVVSHRHYHRHGAYLLQNSDLRSFPGGQSDLLVLLVRGHRRAFPGMALRAVTRESRDDLLKLLAVLRLGVILNRSHSDAHVPELDATVDGLVLRLALPAGWLAGHPMSARELEVEAAQLRDAGIDLRVAEVGSAAALTTPPARRPRPAQSS